MEVILLEKIRNLGSLGEQVRVKNGYARNFLLPTGKAVVANKVNKEQFEARREELEAAQSDQLAKAESRQAKLENMSLELKSRASEEGKLFGSVGSKEIAEAVSNAGTEVSRAEVQFPDGPIKELGDFKVLIALHPEVSVTIAVNVSAE